MGKYPLIFNNNKMSNTVNRTLVVLFFVCISFSLLAQDSIPKKKLSDYLQFQGYLKDLQVANFSNKDSLSTYGFLHNRLNFKFYPTTTISLGLEIRNRFYYGQQVQNTPHFGKYIATDQGYYPLSRLLFNEKSLVLHTMVDRVWINWGYKKWEVRLGRQRINWGKTLVWNPNDLFNTFNYANFDYEEQPGSDALKLSYYPSGMSALEFAIKPGKNSGQTVAAGVWRFNTHEYDFQVLGGLYYTDMVLGAGWAGNLKNAGFKGEASWFQPKTNLLNTTGVLSTAVSVDYSFKKPFYIQGGILYNKHVLKNNITAFYMQQSFANNLSAKNLMPSDWSFFGQITNDITPLLHINLSTIYGHTPQFIFIMPSLSYSLSDNWDLTLLGQGVYFSQINSNPPFNSIYLRLKWSF
jgi:hypothetical protein